MDSIINDIKTYVKDQDQQNKLINFLICSKNGQKIPKLFVIPGWFAFNIADYFGDAHGSMPFHVNWHILSRWRIWKVKNKNLVSLRLPFGKNKFNREYINTLLNDKYFTIKHTKKDNEIFSNTANYYIATDDLTILDNLTKDMYEIIK